MHFDLETRKGVYSVKCESVSTRNGFKHVARVSDSNFNFVFETKINYLNRTWESFQFQSVLEKAKNMIESGV